MGKHLLLADCPLSHGGTNFMEFPVMTVLLRDNPLTWSDLPKMLISCILPTNGKFTEDRIVFGMPISMKFPEHRSSLVTRLNADSTFILCALRHVPKRTWLCCSQSSLLLVVRNPLWTTAITSSEQGPSLTWPPVFTDAGI